MFLWQWKSLFLLIKVCKMFYKKPLTNFCCVISDLGNVKLITKKTFKTVHKPCSPFSLRKLSRLKLQIAGWFAAPVWAQPEACAQNSNCRNVTVLSSLKNSWEILSCFQYTGLEKRQMNWLVLTAKRCRDEKWTSGTADTCPTATQRLAAVISKETNLCARKSRI